MFAVKILTRNKKGVHRHFSSLDRARIKRSLLTLNDLVLVGDVDPSLSVLSSSPLGAHNNPLMRSIAREHQQICSKDSEIHTILCTVHRYAKCEACVYKISVYKPLMCFLNLMTYHGSHVQVLLCRFFARC